MTGAQRDHSTEFKRKVAAIIHNGGQREPARNLLRPPYRHIYLRSIFVYFAKTSRLVQVAKQIVHAFLPVARSDLQAAFASKFSPT